MKKPKMITFFPVDDTSAFTISNIISLWNNMLHKCSAMAFSVASLSRIYI